VEVASDVDAEDTAPRRAPDRRDEGVDAPVVEAEPVHERLRLDEPEQARPRIARLRARRYRSGFEEAEAERREAVEVRGVLVEPRCEADAIGEAQAHHVDRC